MRNKSTQNRSQEGSGQSLGCAMSSLHEDAAYRDLASWRDKAPASNAFMHNLSVDLHSMKRHGEVTFGTYKICWRPTSDGLLALDGLMLSKSHL